MAWNCVTHAPATSERILNAVAERKTLARTTLANCRNFLSGVFRYAIRTDRYTRGNPVRELKTPKGARPVNQYVYHLEEVIAMLAVLAEPARTVILTDAFTGLRACELRAMMSDDFTSDRLHVSRSAWRTHVGETKMAGSTAPVPCVPFLAAALRKHRKANPKSKYIF
jgi:integrase